MERQFLYLPESDDDVGFCANCRRMVSVISRFIRLILIPGSRCLKSRREIVRYLEDRFIQETIECRGTAIQHIYQ